MPLLTATRHLEIFDFPVTRYYERLGFDFDRESFQELGDLFMDRYESRRYEAKLHEDVRDVLSNLQESGLQQSVLSAYQQDTLEELIVHHALENFFADIHGHHDRFASGKVLQARQAMKDLSLSPEEAILVGDTVHDWEIAEELGIACLLIPGGHHSEKKLRECDAPVLRTRTDVRAHLA